MLPKKSLYLKTNRYKQAMFIEVNGDYELEKQLFKTLIYKNQKNIITFATLFMDGIHEIIKLFIKWQLKLD